MRLASDLECMNRCLELARGGIGRVSPNPLVGCVIVRNSKIVGEGFHQQFGGPHAEILALVHAGKKAGGATLFVNLEPCAHFGKTPPCVDAIIRAGIAAVVIATEDPNPLVAGRGVRRLREAGIRVRSGILREEARRLNEKFFKFMESGMPFVGIKIAQTLDGTIADFSGRSRWITSKEARRVAHRLRSEYDAVMVGATTVVRDNPELTVRLFKGRNPVRVVLDGSLSTPVNRKIFTTSAAPTWVLTSKSALRSKGAKARALSSKGVRVLAVSSTVHIGENDILRTLAKEGISSVLIEGGSRTIAGFVSRKSGDKLYLFTAPKILGGGLKAFQFPHPRRLEASLEVTHIRQSFAGNDIVMEADFLK
jgi:diaminohydroxyphosphoribosylaminopyrimidine deaminase/5-amino-6-(5-phosphoribosylamino)uracil reductase